MNSYSNNGNYMYSNMGGNVYDERVEIDDLGCPHYRPPGCVKIFF